MPFSATDGIDVSHYNGQVDWRTVAASGIGFAYCKATEGASAQDSRFSENFPAIAASGLLRGTYHFFHPGIDAGAQAANFLKAVPGLIPGDLPPALDVEVNDGQSASAIAAGVIAWLQKVEQALGRTPVIYTSPGFWRGNLGPSSAFGRYPLWVAHYNVSQPAVPPGFADYTLWQHAQDGSVPGVNGNVDVDVFNGSADDLKSLAGLSQATGATGG